MKLTLNLTLDVPPGFVAVFKPQESGGYSFRMVPEVKKEAPKAPEVTFEKAAQPALPKVTVLPEKRRGGSLLGIRNKGKANLKVCQELAQLGEEITTATFMALSGKSIGYSSGALVRLCAQGHLKLLRKSRFKTPRGWASRNFYSLA